VTAENHKSRLPEPHEDLLRSTAHVATLEPNGEHGKSSQTRRRQKERNINREARLALSIVDPEDPSRYLEIRGLVDRVEEDPDPAFINSTSEKYLGIDEYQNHMPEHTTKMGS
jgi:hypothetical protein